MNETREVLNKVVEVQVNLEYLQFLPDDYDEKREQGYPMLLFLHGGGERGDDLDLLKATGLPKHIGEELTLPLVAICPQCAMSENWDNFSLITLLDEVTRTLNIDAERIYLSGLSLGGRGSWGLANAYADRFAAVAPVCAPFVPINPANFASLPVWCFHGALDPIVSITDSVRMVQLLRNADCDVRFTVYPDANHDSWTETYLNPDLYDWMLKHRRSSS